MSEDKIVILGAGVAGLAASFFLKENNTNTVIYEKNSTYGGLCNSFSVNDFTFDTFAHLIFDKSTEVKRVFEEKTNYIVHKPEALNYYKGEWIRNPVQNNLYYLNIDERIEVIKGFINRDSHINPINYEYWLRKQYGDYFAENFPMKYTKKYWAVDAKELETKWVQGRMYTPQIDEVLRGAMSKETPNVHYSLEMHYPATGGFKEFLRPMAQISDIKYNKQVECIDMKKKTITFSDGEEVEYKQLISTIPLTEMCKIVNDIPDEVKAAGNDLDYTSGVMVSLGLKKKNVCPALWFYIYDDDIYPARVYSPSIKSPNNAPEGCSSIQAEIYFSKFNPLQESLPKLMERTIKQLIKMGLFEEKDIVEKDIRQEKYANVMFTPNVYSAREVVYNYLDSQGIICAGRFGEWKYLWTGQSFISGMNAAFKAMGVESTEEKSF